MTRNTFESLSQELAATGSIPHGNRFGRKAILLQKQVLIFVWFISNLEAMRSVSDRFDVTLSSLERILKKSNRSYCCFTTGIHQVAER